MARHEIPEEERRTHRVNVNFTAEEIAELDNLSSGLRVVPAKMARMLILSGIENFRKNGSTYGKVVIRANPQYDRKVHWTESACRQFYKTELSDDINKVTCDKCLKRIKKANLFGTMGVSKVPDEVDLGTVDISERRIVEANKGGILTDDLLM